MVTDRMKVLKKQEKHLSDHKSKGKQEATLKEDQCKELLALDKKLLHEVRLLCLWYVPLWLRSHCRYENAWVASVSS